MATIIEFRAGDGRSDVRHQDARSAGEIIIFPGVRRERHVHDLEEARPRRREKGKPKRDRLELPE